LLLIEIAVVRFCEIVVVPSSVLNGISRLIALAFSGVATVCVCALAECDDDVAARTATTDDNFATRMALPPQKQFPPPETSRNNHLGMTAQ
jgi:hypothetical protein